MSAFMNWSCTKERSIGGLKHPAALLAALALGCAAGCAAPCAARAQTPDPGDFAEGLRLYLNKGNCQACHGWAGDGRKMDSQMPDGANLRESRLEREGLVLTIKCGRPGRGMPAFDRFAYSDGRCYGMKLDQLKSRGLTLPDPPATLQPREVDLLVDFLLARVVGKGAMDRVSCAEYWGSEVEACAELPSIK
jgi:mono/diheme cytochrome c family protein